MVRKQFSPSGKKPVAKKPLIETLEGRRLFSGVGPQPDSAEALEFGANPATTIEEAADLTWNIAAAATAAPQVTALTIVDTSNGKAVGTLTNGAVLTRSELPAKFSIRADLAGTAGSIRFDLDGKTAYQIENGGPYFLEGNSGSTIRVWNAALGEHTISATPFSSTGAKGTAGTGMTVKFSIVTEPSQSVAPAAPSNLVAQSVTTSDVKLAWQDNSNNEGSFVIERSTDGQMFARVGNTAANVATFTETGLTAGTSYWYRVSAANAAGASGYSAAVKVTTAAAPQPEPDPNPNPNPTLAVTSLTLINADNGQAIMTLTDGATLDLAALPTRNLNVRANVSGTTGSVQFVYDGSVFRTESGAPYALAGDTGTGYYAWTPTEGAHTLKATPYTQRAGAGEAGTAVTVRFTVTDNPVAPTLPAAPTGLAASTASASQVNLAWTDASSNESGFKIERSTDGVNFTQIAAVGANVKTYASTGLAAETKYHYRVRAYNAAGNSAYTAVASATTAKATTPTTPSGKFPDATNTGPTNRNILKVMTNSVTITQDGAVLENFHMKGGTITVAANNVTIRNFIMENPGTTGAAIKMYNSDVKGAVIQDGEIFGGTATNGVSGSNYTARRLHIYNMRSDCFRVKENVTIEGCYLHDFGQGPESHGDGVQMYPTDGGNMRIIGNRIDARGANAALFQVNGGWHIEGNYFNGGNYTIQCGGEAGNKFINNTFGRDSKYGPIRVGSGSRSLLTWTGNVWADTGAPVPL